MINKVFEEMLDVKERFTDPKEKCFINNCQKASHGDCGFCDFHCDFFLDK